MPIEDRANAVIESIDKLLEELLEIVGKVQGDRDHEAARQRLDRWEVRTVTFLGSSLGSQEKERFENETRVNVSSYIDLVGNRVKEAAKYEAYLIALKEELETHPETALSQSHSNSEDLEDLGIVRDTAPSGDLRESGAPSGPGAGPT